ncbi:MAG: hypothetical protein CM15mP102_13400 [Flavobacteriales bacterium]|nr:MAG: hypothetical protein CM15mP102_13400 [Flavobacteriales bacterium]
MPIYFLPFSGIDPRVQTNDMSSDPISYSIDRMQLVNGLLMIFLINFKCLVILEILEEHSLI